MYLQLASIFKQISQAVDDFKVYASNSCLIVNESVNGTIRQDYAKSSVFWISGACCFKYSTSLWNFRGFETTRIQGYIRLEVQRWLQTWHQCVPESTSLTVLYKFESLATLKKLIIPSNVLVTAIPSYYTCIQCFKNLRCISLFHFIIMQVRATANGWMTRVTTGCNVC